MAFNDVFLTLAIILLIAASAALFLKKPEGTEADGVH